MDCLRSFIIKINQNGSFTGATTKTWLSGTELFFSSRITGLSTFEFQGFKNVDIYGIDVVGFVGNYTAAAAGGVVVQDWAFEFRVTGQYPLASGLVTATPNFWSINNPTTTNIFELSKNTNSLKFANPIKSSKLILFDGLNVTGTGGQTSGTVSIDYDLNFIVYYKYEGE